MRILIACLVLLGASTAHAALDRVTTFGSNPGALDMYVHVPADLPDGAPLVVVMHGCSQTASAMEAAGWNALADARGFAVLYPEQRTANNPVRCFNWAGEYGDLANLTRGQGENQSILSMIDHMISTHGIDGARVHVAGFSAGAAFAAVLLATWPDRFASGAIMSGLPFRCATDVSGAYDCQSMHLHPERQKSAAQWGDLVRAAHPGYAGPRPRVQIWHGTADSIVADENQLESIEQWTNVLGIDVTADATETLGTVSRTEYRSGSTVLVEAFTATGMGHAVCVGRTDATYPCGPQAASYYEDEGVCSTWRAARFFGLLDGGGPGTGDDTTAPSVDVVAPSSGATVSGAVTVVVAASDEVGVVAVDVLVDGVLAGTDTMAPFQVAWSTAGVGDGVHAITAVAYDAAGNQASDADTEVTVTNGDGGGGGGGGGDDDDDDDGPGGDNALPGCGLDAGGGGGAATPVALALLLLLGAAIRTGRRDRRSPRRRAPRS